MSSNAVSNYMDLLSSYIGLAFINQSSFAGFLSNSDWNIDLNEETIYFRDTKFPVELIGTESKASNSWLWAYANPGNFSNSLLSEVKQFSAFCKKEIYTDLTDDELPLTDIINGHNISSIISAMKGNMCYYKCPFNENVSLFVLVKSIPPEIFKPASAQTAANAIMSLIKTIPLNHELLVKSIFNKHASDIQETDNSIEGLFLSETSFTVKFDNNGRVENLSYKSK